MENNDGMNKLLVPAAVVLAGLLIGGAVIWNGSRPAGTGAPTGVAPKVDIKDVKIDGEAYIGKSDAPVTIAFWSDAQCPFCKQFELVTLPQIIQTYVDTGKVKVVFKDFAFLGEDSAVAARYSRSVWNLYPEQYFAWRTALYEAQDEEGGQGFGNAESIDKLNATIPGFDAAKIAADVVANKAAYDAAANANKAEAQSFGINATPSFIVGTQVIAGAYPYPTFQEAIDKLLK